MSSRIRSKAILKVVGIAVFAAMFCVGCGDKDKGDGDDYIPYTITLDPDGGEVSPDSVTVDIMSRSGIGSLMSIPPTPTRDGYTFRGWYTAKGGHGNLVLAGTGTAGFGGNSTLYAHWELAHYRVTFDAHGGEVTPAYDSTDGDWKLASLPMPTRDALHTFNGWWTAPIDGTGEKVDIDREYRANTTLYAHWIYTGVHYKITFDANEGTVDPASEETDAGGKLQDLPLPEKDGYAFVGWFKGKTDGEVVSTETVFEGDATIYARWILITDKIFKVTFSAHDGTVYPEFGMAGEDGKLLTPLPTPKRDGFAFQGWFTEDGEVTAGTVFTADATIHARWTIIHYTITLDATGGDVTPTTVTTGSHWELMDDLPVPTRDGYTFRGWFTAETGGTNVVPRSTVLMGNLTIYAHWSLNDGHFTITFDANGGEVSPASAETGDGYKLASFPVPTRDGYVFHGWFTDKTGDTHVTMLTKFESDVTIYAQWTPVVRGGAVTYGGETYQTVIIGTQTWFDRNLNYDIEGSKCYGQDGTVPVNSTPDVNGVAHFIRLDTLSAADVQANCERYGRLYDWEAALSACPTGWHLPSSDEWETLIDFVGGNSVAGLELRSASAGEISEYIIVGADNYGFSALPGGVGGPYRNAPSYYAYSWGGHIGHLWSSSEYNSTVGRSLFANFDLEEAHFQNRAKNHLLSVRCIMD